MRNRLTLFAVSIRSIREIRIGKSTDVLRDKEVAGCYSEDCVFSVIYGDDFESLDLVASTPDEANFWVTGLNMLIAANRCEQLHLSFVNYFLLVACLIIVEVWESKLHQSRLDQDTVKKLRLRFLYLSHMPQT